MSVEDLTEMLDAACKSLVEARGGSYSSMEDLKKVAVWLTSQRRFGLLLVGSVGTGKTTIARAIAAVINHLQFGRVNYEKDGVRYKGFVSYGEWQQEGVNYVSEVSAIDICRIASTDQVRYESIMKDSALFIDDLGNEPTAVKNYGSEVSPVAELIDYRNDKQMFTIATSNLSPRMSDGKSQFYERYGDRTSSRMGELFDIITIKGQDHRKEAK